MYSTFGEGGGLVTSTVPAFLTKLWTLVEDPSTDELICWDAVGVNTQINFLLFYICIV